MTFSLITSRLELATLDIGDVDAFVAYRRAPEVAKYQSWDESYSKEQAEELVQSQSGLDFPIRGDWLQIAIRDRSSGALLGDLALHAMEEEGHFELGFTLAPEHQGKGYAFEAATALLNGLFRECRAESVVAFTDRRNSASKSLLAKLGFLEDPAKTWVEEFKGETVEICVFELTAPPPQQTAART